MNPRKFFLACFAVVILLISYDDLIGCYKKTNKVDLPFPPRFIATAIVFGLLDVLSGIVGEVAVLAGGGYVLAILICTACPSPGSKSQCPGCNMRITASDCNAKEAFATSQPDAFTPMNPTAQPQQTGTTSGTNAASNVPNTATGAGFTPNTPGQPAV